MASAAKRGKYFRGRYKDDKGVWQWLPRDADGNRFKTKSDAKAAATTLEEKAKQGTFISPKSGRMLLGTWVETWLAALDVDDLSERDYRVRLNAQILPEWSAVPVGDITTAAFRIWEKRLRKEYSANYVRGIISVFRTVLDDAVIEKLRGDNPVPTRKAARRGKFKAPAATDEVVFATPRQALLVARNALEFRGLSMYVQVLVHAYAGLRIGEVKGLHRDRLVLGGAPQGDYILLEAQSQYVGGKPAVRPPKYGSSRDLIIPRFLAELLQQLIDSHKNGLVFTAPKGGEMASSGEFYQKSWRPVVDGAPPRPSSRGHKARPGIRPVVGVEGMVPHGLRHSMKVWLDEAGHPSVAVEGRMGHQLRGVEGTYSHTTPAMELAIAATLQRLWEESCKAPDAAGEYGPVPKADVPAE